MLLFRQKELRIKHYVSIIGALAVIPVLILGILLSYDFIKKGNELRQQHLASVNEVHEEIENFLEIHMLALDTIAHQTVQMNAPPAQIKEIIQQVTKHYGGFSEIYLDTPDFQLSTRIPSVTRNYRELKQRLLFQYTSPADFLSLKDPYISPLIRDVSLEETIFIAVSVRKYNGDFYGYLIGSLDLDHLAKAIEKHEIYPSSYTVLVDSMENTITFPADKKISISGISYPIIDQLKTKGSGSLEYHSPAFDRWEIAGFLTVPEYGMGVWTAVPRQEVLMPLFRVASLFIVVIIISLFIILAIRHLLTVTISKPLTELDFACQEFSSGNLNYRVQMNDSKLPAEIETLANKFNYMVAGMQHTTTLLKIHSDDLEERVAERTRELANINKELSALYAVASSVSSTHDLEIVLANVLKEIVTLFQVEASSIWVNKEKGEKNVLSYWQLDLMEEEKKAHADYLESFSWQCILEGHTVLHNDLENAFGKSRQIKLKSLVSVPIRHNDNILGTITLASSSNKRFVAQEIILLQAVCNQLGVLISNVSLFNVINKEHNTLLAVMNSMNEGLIIFDSNARLIYTNPVFTSLFKLEGLSWQNVLFQDLKGFMQAAGMDVDWEKLWDDFLNKNEFQEREAIMVRKEKRGYYLFMGFPVSSGGDFIGYGYIIRDITRDKEIDSLRNSILSTVSHELRTPLTTIRGCAESLLRKDVEWDATESEEFLTAIVDESNRLRELIKNIMDMSKIEAGALNLDRHYADIGKLIERIVGRFRQRFPGMEISVELDENVPFVLIDERRMEQVLNNLLENAIKYSEGTPRVIIRTVYCAYEDQVAVSVIDHGIGIDPQYKTAIFERFYRIDTPHSNKVGGSGVGLSIAKGIVEAHGGSIRLDSMSTLGSKFTFTIPCTHKNEGGIE